MSDAIKPEKIKEVLDSNKSVGKILQIVNLRQDERIMKWESDLIKSKISKLERELTVKHKLAILDIGMLIYTFQQEEHKGLIAKVKERWKKASAKPSKR